MLKLKIQYFGHLTRRTDSFEKTLMLGGIVGRKRSGWQRTRWLDGITDVMDVSFSKLQEMVRDRKVWPTAVHGITKSQTWRSNWTTITWSSTTVTNFLSMFSDNNPTKKPVWEEILLVKQLYVDHHCSSLFKFISSHFLKQGKSFAKSIFWRHLKIHDNHYFP